MRVAEASRLKAPVFRIDDAVLADALARQQTLPGKAGARGVPVGEIVAAGATVTAVEAMKMQHALVAPRDARIVRWRAGPGSSR